MQKAVSRFRLQSSAFARKDETEKIEPKRMVFLSVEGDQTERTYFQNLNDYLDTQLIQIEVLRHRRGDGYSDPKYVIELLEEYIDVRQGDLIPKELPKAFTEKYSKDFRFLYKGIIIKHNKTEPTYTKTSLFLCEKRRFFMARTEKGVVATI